MLQRVCQFVALSTGDLQFSYMSCLCDMQMPAPVNLPGCDSFVYFGGDKGSCDLEEVRKQIDSGAVGSVEAPLITEADHKYPSFVWNQETHPIAVLVGSLTSPTTKILHDYLK